MQLVLTVHPDGRLAITGPPNLTPKDAIRLLLNGIAFFNEQPAATVKETPLIQEATLAQIPPTRR